MKLQKNTPILVTILMVLAITMMACSTPVNVPPTVEAIPTATAPAVTAQVSPSPTMVALTDAPTEEPAANPTIAISPTPTVAISPTPTVELVMGTSDPKCEHPIFAGDEKALECAPIDHWEELTKVNNGVQIFTKTHEDVVGEEPTTKQPLIHYFSFTYTLEVRQWNRPTFYLPNPDGKGADIPVNEMYGIARMTDQDGKIWFTMLVEPQVMGKIQAFGLPVMFTQESLDLVVPDGAGVLQIIGHPWWDIVDNNDHPEEGQLVLIGKTWPEPEPVVGVLFSNTFYGDISYGAAKEKLANEVSALLRGIELGIYTSY